MDVEVMSFESLVIVALCKPEWVSLSLAHPPRTIRLVAPKKAKRRFFMVKTRPFNSPRTIRRFYVMPCSFPNSSADAELVPLRRVTMHSARIAEG